MIDLALLDADLSVPIPALPGELVLKLGGQQRLMRTTLRAAMIVNAAFGGYEEAHARVRKRDIEAMRLILAAGLGERTETGMAALEQALFASGGEALAAVLTDYVILLSNGGRKEAPAGGKTKAGRGPPMSTDAYLEHLLKVAVGWLGWTEDQALDSLMRSVELALIGRQEMFEWVYAPAAPPQPKRISLDDDEGMRALFDSFS